jgi:antitoxin component of RelBE/YafQ-DinJ toxin-antitoxin module
MVGTWKRYSISINPDVWENAKKIIESEAGLTMSKYIEITLKALPRADQGSTKDFVQETIMDFVNATEKKKPVVKVKKKK